MKKDTKRPTIHDRMMLLIEEMVEKELPLKEAIKEFKTLAKQRSQALLEELDAWLSQHEVDPDNENARYISLGIYYYEHENSGE